MAYSYLITAWWAYLKLDLPEATRQIAIATAVLEGGALEPEAEYTTRPGAAVIAFERYPLRRAALREISAIWRRPLGFLPCVSPTPRRSHRRRIPDREPPSVTRIG